MYEVRVTEEFSQVKNNKNDETNNIYKNVKKQNHLKHTKYDKCKMILEKCYTWGQQSRFSSYIRHTKNKKHQQRIC